MESKVSLRTIYWFSDEHSTLVANVQNLTTGYISPQYHVLFDDLFETAIREGENGPVIDRICNDLFDSSRYWYAEEEFDSNGQLIYRPPPLADLWLDERGRRERKDKHGKQRLRQEQRMQVKSNYVSLSADHST